MSENEELLAESAQTKMSKLSHSVPHSGRPSDPHSGVPSDLPADLPSILISNLPSWLWSSGAYAHNLSGLAACYTAAIPFFRHTLESDLLYTAVLFGAHALLSRRVAPAERVVPQPA